MATNNATNTANPVAVAQGGTGLTTVVPLAVACGGTSATAPFQQTDPPGPATTVLTSNGAGTLPTWAAPGGPSRLTLLRTQGVGGQSEAVFDLPAGFTNFQLTINNVSNQPGIGGYVALQTSQGSGWDVSGYTAGILTNNYNSTTLTSTSSQEIIPLSTTVPTTLTTIAGMYTIMRAASLCTVIGQCYTTTTTAIFTRAFASCASNVTALRVIFTSDTTAPFTPLLVIDGSVSLYAYS